MYIANEMYIMHQDEDIIVMIIATIDNDNKIDIPYQEKERIKQSLDNFIQTYSDDKK